MIKYQFNKTSLGDLGRQLRMRRRALPTIKSKEAALRVEVARAKQTAAAYAAELAALKARYDYMAPLWGEFDETLLEVADVELSVKKIAGVKIPSLDNIVFKEREYDLFAAPAWLADGVALLRELARIGIEHEFFLRKQTLLERARKKTTQKVNLYEKVQIPGYEEAILKIKRFLEDEENLSKSSQKIVKSRHERQAREEAV